jgi:hypothetical protein
VLNGDSGTIKVFVGVQEPTTIAPGSRFPCKGPEVGGHFTIESNGTVISASYFGQILLTLLNLVSLRSKQASNMAEYYYKT